MDTCKQSHIEKKINDFSLSSNEEKLCLILIMLQIKLVFAKDGIQIQDFFVG